MHEPCGNSRLTLIVVLLIASFFLVGCQVEDEEPSNTGRVGGTTGGAKTYETRVRLSDGRIVTCIIARDAEDSGNLSGKGVGVGVSCDWENAK
jgi:hypothetical protein